MPTVSKGLRGFQRFVVPILGSINAIGAAGLVLAAALTEPALYTVAPVLTFVATTVLVSVAAATAILLIGYGVPHILRLTTTVILAMAIGMVIMLPVRMTPATADAIGGTLVPMLLASILVLAGIAGMCTQRDGG
jgi:hypothetical protein